MKYQSSNPNQKQQGVALVAALLFVALATMLAVNAAWMQQLFIKRTATMVYKDQAIQYNLSIESWARQLLSEDLEASDIDHLGEDWAQSLPLLPIEGGHLAAQAEDLQSRFNLNNLVSGDTVNSLELARFLRLLEHLDLPEGIAYAVIDWLDANADPSGLGGAEDNIYLSAKPPYRTANTAMSSTTELLLIHGVTYEHYKLLSPLVCTLPEYTKININTAKETLLYALSDAITALVIEQIKDIQQDARYSSMSEFTEHMTLLGIPLTTTGLSINSSYFSVSSSATIGKLTSYSTSRIKRDSNTQTTVISRSFMRPDNV
ncbi:MAG: type II secretion system minor pseudopilin GspK [Gammaproteobacteria bacterium]|nr:type II secretion system minor pseudopilin GspK [Gammaproteobacteria bacterium]